MAIKSEILTTMSPKVAQNKLGGPPATSQNIVWPIKLFESGLALIYYYIRT